MAEHQSTTVPTAPFSYYTASWTALDDKVAQAKEFLAYYGWPIVFTIISMYLTWPYITAFRQRCALANANDPARRKTLDIDRARVRELQQQKVAESVAAEAEAKKPTATKKAFPSTKF